MKTPDRERVLIISVVLARRELFVDMELIELILAMDREITKEDTKR